MLCVLQCVAVCCSVSRNCSSRGMQHDANVLQVYCSVLQCVPVCCSVLQYVAVCCIVAVCHVIVSLEGCGLKLICCSMLQCVAVCCSVLQCVAVRCSVLQYVAVCCQRACA